MKNRSCSAALVLLCGLLLHAALVPAAAADTKWVIFIYMLADNDLEQFGLMDMEVSSAVICPTAATTLRWRSIAQPCVPVVQAPTPSAR
jgi:hypothetical protein